MKKTLFVAGASMAIMVGSYAAAQQAVAPPMNFFVTSVGSGNGGNLGGLEGADKHCAALAQKAGSAKKQWRAYLSTQGAGAVNARDRIGAGPWFNAKGGKIADNAAVLHGDTLELAQIGNSLSKVTAIDETGAPVKGVGDTPNEHDILTGSKADGRAYTDAADHTCKNWTSSAADGSAQLGHFDRMGGPNVSWNSVHPSRGCGQKELVATGGAGRLYCFALD
jgi:hypothetical protein